jgi:hypothetical protein
MKFKLSIWFSLIGVVCGGFLFIVGLYSQLFSGKVRGWDILITILFELLGILMMTLPFARIEFSEYGLQMNRFSENGIISYSEMTVIVKQGLPFPGYMLFYQHEGCSLTKYIPSVNDINAFCSELLRRCPTIKIK